MSTEPTTQLGLEAEAKAAREDLAATLAALRVEADPRVRARRVAVSAQQAVHDAALLVKGEGLPEGSPRRVRNVRIALGAAALVLAGVVTAGIKAVRR